MYYKVVDAFGPQSGPRWRGYELWSHHEQLRSFDSVDSILREDRFQPASKEDWDNCVNEDFKLSLITSLDFARRVHHEHPGSQIVGVEPDVDDAYRPERGLVGYDIIDAHCSVSLITNWGNDGEVFEVEFQDNGLIGELRAALRVRDRLRSRYRDDPHASGCQVWAIYSVEP